MRVFIAFRKPCSGYKLKEMTGSKIFTADNKDASTESGTFDAANGISQISFSIEEKISPKKTTTLPEVAKQRELSGTLESESESRAKKQLSDAKCKELSGSDIFGPPPEIPPRSSAAARTMGMRENKDMGEPAPRCVRTSVKVSNMRRSFNNVSHLQPAGGQSNIMFGDEPEIKTTKKIHNHKFVELTGTDIFKGDVPPGSAEKPLSVAKLKEMSGNNIFADGKVESRDYFGGVRKPPGGESSIALV
ncbi:UNVERIFIED_CONTAM: hypothetical protein Sradi_6877300 [Sesamum radiatum]|uniref:DUF4057 domain-containing protein n=1 Tax=Sesamum radiatum TaxID=300843 RepID=A0AAW2JJ96_SESRA